MKSQGVLAGDAFKSKNLSSAQREVEGFEAANAKIHGTVLSIHLLYPRGEERRLNTRSEGMGWDLSMGATTKRFRMTRRAAPSSPRLPFHDLVTAPQEQGNWSVKYHV